MQTETETDNRIVHVVGPDIDRELVKTLTEGDRILVEMNGVRVFTTHYCTLVADEPWRVKSNTSFALTIEHPSIKHDLILPYSALLKSSLVEPAVFVIDDRFFSKSGPLYVILQFISYRMNFVDVGGAFKLDYDVSVFDSILADSDARRAVLQKISQRLGKFKHPGWGYRSLCRFALRASVRVKVIEAFRNRDWPIIMEQSVETIKRIASELAWIGHFSRLSEDIDFGPAIDDLPTKSAG